MAIEYEIVLSREISEIRMKRLYEEGKAACPNDFSKLPQIESEGENVIDKPASVYGVVLEDFDKLLTDLAESQKNQNDRALTEKPKIILCREWKV